MRNLNDLIPENVRLDPWLVFHGTSNICEAGIEELGLVPDTQVVSKEQVSSIVAIFEDLRWHGIHRGGFDILKSFTLHHDFSHENGKPIYLAESAFRAATFAGKDFAGGEGCRALHHSLLDLFRFLESETLRNEHLEYLNTEAEERRKDGAVPLPFPNLRLEQLEKKLGALTSLKERLEKTRSEYTYGLIYAVRLEPLSLEKLHYHNTMGIKCFRPISRDEIIFKYRLPSDITDMDLPFESDRDRLRAKTEPGIVKTIQNVQRQST